MLEAGCKDGQCYQASSPHLYLACSIYQRALLSFKSLLSSQKCLEDNVREVFLCPSPTYFPCICKRSCTTIAAVALLMQKLPKWLHQTLALASQQPHFHLITPVSLQKVLILKNWLFTDDRHLLPSPQMKDKGIAFQILKTDKLISKPARPCLEEVHINGMFIHSAKPASGVPGIWSQYPSQRHPVLSTPTVGTFTDSCWAPGSSAHGAGPLPWAPGGAAGKGCS